MRVPWSRVEDYRSKDARRQRDFEHGRHLHRQVDPQGLVEVPSDVDLPAEVVGRRRDLRRLP